MRYDLHRVCRKTGTAETAAHAGILTSAISARSAVNRRLPRLRLLPSSLCGTPADAHPAPFTFLDLRIAQGAIEGSLVAHIFDLGHDLKVDPAERLLDPSVAAQQGAAIAALFAARLTVKANGITLTPQWSNPRGAR